jgi:MFS family permease
VDRLGVEVLARYRSVLSAPGLLRVLITALLARLPQGMMSLAVLLLVRQDTRSYVAAGVAVGAEALSNAIGSPVQGRLVDRFGRRAVLGPIAAGQAVVLVGLVAAASSHAPAAVDVVLAGLGGALQPSIAPAVRSLLSGVLAADERESAYALDSVIQELIWMAGPLLVAVLVSLASPAGAVLFGATICLLGTALFVSSPIVADSRAVPAQQRGAHALRIPALRALLGPIALMGAGIGATEVGLPSLALHAGSRPSTGLLLALWSAGSMTGGLWYGSRHWQVPLSARYRGLLVVAVICAAPLIVARTIPEGAAFSFLAGLTIAPVFSCQYALIGDSVTAGNETEAFTWTAAALVTGIAAGSALAGVAVSAAGVSGPFIIGCAAAALAALAAVRLRPVIAQTA